MSIQGLILVPEPYYNEPSYEQYRGSEEGKRASSQVKVLRLISSPLRQAGLAEAWWPVLLYTDRRGFRFR